MRKYEIMYILKADLDETARAAEMNGIFDILKANGAEVTNTDEKLGMRDLAFPIKDQKRGYYVVIKVTADQAALNELSRKVSINPNVLRHLVTVDQD